MILEVTDISDSYNMKEMLMPLHDFINDPIAHDIIHNGATFQVAGLTNNSCLDESHAVRHCVRKHPELGQYALDVAKAKRLDDMLYVGLTEDHKESATMFANMVGVQVLSLLEALSSRADQAAKNETELDHQFSDSKPDNWNQLQSTSPDQKASKIPSAESDEMKNEDTTVLKLMDGYETCSSGLQRQGTARRTNSLERIVPAKFTKEARGRVPQSVIRKMLSLNSLDVELYKHA